MKRTRRQGGFRKATSRRRRNQRSRPAYDRQTGFEVLEDRTLLAADFGDAPDLGVGTGHGNYNTLLSDNGPRHTIVAGLKLGVNVDPDTGLLQNASANADDVNGALPDDEDGLTNPAADLALTVGDQPRVNVRATNVTGSDATLSGWIDYNADGVFDNTTERASISVSNGTNNGIVTLVFPIVPRGFTGTTYARFRISTDPAAANPTGAAHDGEVEDYQATITGSSTGFVDSAKTQKIASSTGGGPTLSNLDIFGGSVVPLGDLDGNGVTDLAVGIGGDSTGGSNRGAVDVLFMNANGTVKSSQKIANGIGGGPTLADGDYFGSSVASLGDLNGDGVPDLAVGANTADAGGTNRGAAYVLFMNANGTVKTSQKIASGVGGGPSLTNYDFFGTSMTSLGDLDGDGVTDLAVGAKLDDTGGTNRGAVYVLFMNANGTVKGSQKIASATGGGPILTNDSRFGSSVTSLGDFDGDGVTDLAVSAIYDSTGGTNRGAVYVLFMNTNGTVKDSQKIASGTGGGPSLANRDQFGSSVTAIGDLNGDGLSDLAVGANYDDTGGNARGAVYVLFMNSSGTAKSTQKIANNVGGGPSLANGDYFGGSVANLGDIDGDGVTDLAVGADSDNTGGISRGAVYVLFLKADNSPQFTSPDMASVAENTTAVLTVTATDADLPAQTVTFSIVGGADQSQFTITSDGQLSFSAAPDFEMPTDTDGDNVYALVVQADDGDGGITTQAINVTVTQVNDNSPQFTSPDMASVAENTTAVLTVTATDADLPAQTVTFSIVGGADQSQFTITSDGQLSFSAAPDFEMPTDTDGDNVYALVVQADDGDGGITTQAINVTVTQVNDNSPQFTSPDMASVAENTTAVLTVTATDADLPAQTVTFSIVGGADQSQFTITSDGQLSFSAAPDFEMPTDTDGDNVYALVVQADDGDGGITTQAINVTVTQVNDNSPQFTSPDMASVAENTTAVLTVTATDADLPAQTVTFSIVGGADQSQFTITSDGQLSFSAAPDFEMPTDTDGDNVYALVVQADDGDGGITTQAINVTVTQVNDNSPQFTSPDMASVAENTTAVLTVTATDADLPAQTVTFSIVGGADQSQFTITSDGQLSFSAAPDFEMPTDTDGDNVYALVVQADDGDGGITTQAINVTVTQVNDNSPQFTSPDMASVAENTTAVLTKAVAAPIEVTTPRALIPAAFDLALVDWPTSRVVRVTTRGATADPSWPASDFGSDVSDQSLLSDVAILGQGLVDSVVRGS